MKSPIFKVGLVLLFSWIIGLGIDYTIQNGILNYPDSYKSYQLIQNILKIDNIITTFFIFLFIIGTILFFRLKISHQNFTN